MAANNDEIDSQILVENVSFLDNCFDNSFTLYNSLNTVKNSASDIHNNISLNKNNNAKRTARVNFTCNLDVSTKVKETVNQPNNNTDIKNLKNWGLPHEITKKYEAKGITEMFDWQVSCLSKSTVLLEHRNLVYSAPTSAGKTLVAEILTIKTILERQKKVLIILPFVSIVREKTFYLQDILSSSGIRVEGFMGSQSPPGGLQAVHVAICTIEKANSLVNRLIDENNISELGAVVVDELHLLGDSHRGYILELLLTKIKYFSLKTNNIKIQIIGMSATLPNLEVLASWLDAELFITNFRPVPLEEYCLVRNKLYNKHGKCLRSIESSTEVENDIESVLNMCLETIKEGCSVLIFCTTKNRCENLAQGIASAIFQLGSTGNKIGAILRSQLKSESIAEVLEQLKNCPVGLDTLIKNIVSFGVAYHHAGLTFDERDIIEGAFKLGVIRVLVATSTLSSGVNLPARKVIIRSPMFQRQPLNILTYKQMVGRAGRMGKDIKGESILMCTEAEKKIGLHLMAGILEPVQSCIKSEDRYMRAILEIIASQDTCTAAELDLYSKCLLLYNQEGQLLSEMIFLKNTLEQLQNYELIRIQNTVEEIQYVATSLGNACLSSSMAPNDGLSLFCELQKARQCIVLETDLHLIYLVTPYSVSSQWHDIDWLHLFTLWESLTRAMKKVGELVGIEESFIIQRLRGGSKLKVSQNKLNIHKRFYTALALQDLVNEIPLSQVAAKFQCARGFLQGLQQASATFAGMVTAFCRQLGWKNMELLISQFQDRLHFGVHSELIDLMKLTSLNGVRARALFEGGFETIASIASANVNTIENILFKAVPFQSEKERDEDDVGDLMKRNKIKNIWITGYFGVTAKEAAQNLIYEARKYLQHEIGVTEIKWNDLEDRSANHDLIKISGDNYSSNKKVALYKELCTNNGTPENVILNVDAPGLLNASKNIDGDEKSEKRKSILVTGMLISDGREDGIIGNGQPSDQYSHEGNPTNNDIGSQNIENIDSSLLNYDSISVNDGPSILNKEDIEWDSLYFSIGLDNISKFRTLNKASPVVNVGDNALISDNIENVLNNDSAKSSSDKDISLFSSDGNDSSLFDETLPIDLLPSAYVNSNSLKLENAIDSANNNVTIDCKSILNAFTSSITINEVDDEIKLIYEEDKKECDKLEFLKMSQDYEVKNSQEVIEQYKYKSPLKRQGDNVFSSKQPLLKKVKKITWSESNIEAKALSCKHSKNVVFGIKEKLIHCYILRENDLSEFLKTVQSRKDASIYLDISDSSSSNEIIGSKVFRKNASNHSAKATFKELIKGIAVCLSEDLCVYFDLTSVTQTIDHFKKKISQWLTNKSLTLKFLSFKTAFVLVKHTFGCELTPSSADLSLAEWLIQSDEKIPDINYLMKKYFDIDLSAEFLMIEGKAVKLDNTDPVIDKLVKAWCVWSVSKKQQDFLRDQYFQIHEVTSIEMHVSKILATCEYYGLAVDRELASKLLIDVKNSQEILQKKAYKLCGYHFNFNSSKDVAKVLGIYRGRKVSTKKSVLTAHNSPMASVVIYWRKLNAILTKTLYPLTENASNYGTNDRINPSYTMHTCTGRITMREPNLQNIPRTFSIPAKYLTPTSDNDRCTDVIEFNCRNIFKASPGCVFVSADYCQLEMRILTHYSRDPVLTKIMRSDVDVFKAIAASWSCLPEEEVDDDLRQKSKQLCYGILYGMGNRTLSQHLDVTEAEAAVFMDSFYKTYPSIKMYTQSIIDTCRKQGYVETLKKRRRFLPDINSHFAFKRSAAERQAVNTTIQGSAADIAKAAMCALDNATETLKLKPRLILQMHDELIYEVSERSVRDFVKILKNVMEDTVCLQVPLPVKVRSGLTWGTLKEMNL